MSLHEIDKLIFSVLFSIWKVTLHHWKTYEDQLHWNLLISSRIFIFSSQAKHNLSVKTQFHRLVLSKFYHLYCRAVLRSYSVSIYRFKRDNFLSENVIFESKTCIQNGQYFERRLDLTSCECDDRRVERLVPPSLPNENAEDCWRQWDSLRSKRFQRASKLFSGFWPREK